MNEFQWNRLAAQQFIIESAKLNYETECFAHVKPKTAINDVVSQHETVFFHGFYWCLNNVCFVLSDFVSSERRCMFFPRVVQSYFNVLRGYMWVEACDLNSLKRQFHAVTSLLQWHLIKPFRQNHYNLVVFMGAPDRLFYYPAGAGFDRIVKYDIRPEPDNVNLSRHSSDSSHIISFIFLLNQKAMQSQ